jgi:hypothetical protein
LEPEQELPSGGASGQTECQAVTNAPGLNNERSLRQEEAGTGRIDIVDRERLVLLEVDEPAHADLQHDEGQEQ